MDFGAHGGYVLFEEHNRVDSRVVLRLIQDRTRDYRLDGPLKLRIARELEDETQRFSFVTELLGRLMSPAA